MDTYLITVDFNKESDSSEWKQAKADLQETLSKLGFPKELPPTTTYRLRSRKNQGTVRSELRNVIDPDDNLALCKADGSIYS